MDSVWSPRLHLMVPSTSLVSYLWKQTYLSSCSLCLSIFKIFSPQLAQFTSQIFSTEEDAEQVTPLQNNFRHIHPTFSRIVSMSKDAKLFSGTAGRPLRAAVSVQLLHIVLLGVFFSRRWHWVQIKERYNAEQGWMHVFRWWFVVRKVSYFNLRYSAEVTHL